jgi:hypothetical protein
VKLVINIAVGVLIVCASFYGTLWGIDYFEADPRPAYEVEFNTVKPAFYPGAKVDLTNRGVQITSVFDKQSATADTDGAAYFNIPSKSSLSASGKRLRIEYDVTTEPGDAGQRIMVQFVQNGLKSSGWQQLSTVPGRGTYALLYQSPKDGRDASKSDTIWLKSDADGRGRTVLLHKVSIYVD